MSTDHSPDEDRDLTDADYRQLAELRTGLRSFLRWSAAQARAAGVTPTQHQLLLAVRASTAERGPTVGDVAAALLVQHHSAVELADRAEAAGLIDRRRDPEVHSLVRLTLTGRGRDILRSLSRSHRREIAQLAPTMRALWDVLDVGDPPAAGADAEGDAR